MTLRFHNLNPHPDLGSNAYSLEWNDLHLGLDAGLHPKHLGFDATPKIPTSPLDAFFLSHAHLDHVGTLPLFARANPTMPIYGTPNTFAAADAILHNSVNVMTSQRSELDVTEYPLFTHDEVKQMGSSLLPCHTSRDYPLFDSDIRFRFHHAGHVMGASALTLRSPEHHLVYSGDFNDVEQTLEHRSQLPQDPVDTLILESTHGALTEELPDRAQEKERFLLALQDTLTAGGSVLIPVFALGKTQEVILMLHEFIEAGELPPYAVHIGGLSAKMTRLLDKSHHPHRHHPSIELLKLPWVISPKRGKLNLNYTPRTIYALSSGMMSENTLSNQFAQSFIQNPKNAVLFVGYTDPSTPGYRLRNSQKGDAIQLDSHKATTRRQCEVHSFQFSGHVTRSKLIDYAQTLQPKNLLLVHGDPQAKESLKASLAQALPKSRILIPKPLESIELVS